MTDKNALAQERHAPNRLPFALKVLRERLMSGDHPVSEWERETVKLIAEALRTPAPMTDNNALAQPDWTQIAKAAGEHGVRYRTNSALLAFLAEIRTPAPVAGDVGELVEAAYREGHQRGRIDGSWLEEAEDWSKSKAHADMLERLAGSGEKRAKYPDDGGLREQVRPLGESFNGFQMIREHFGLGEPVQQAGGDQVERVACAIYGEDTLDGLGDVADKMRGVARAALAAMQAKENNP